MRTGEIKVERIPEGAPTDPIALMQKIVDDCPECRALRARGEAPVVIDGASMRRAHDIFRKRPRWRDLKRKARR